MGQAVGDVLGAATGGLLSNKGASQAGQQAASAQQALSQQAFQEATGYQKQQEEALRTAIMGLLGGGGGPTPLDQGVGGVFGPQSPFGGGSVSGLAAVGGPFQGQGAGGEFRYAGQGYPTLGGGPTGVMPPPSQPPGSVMSGQPEQAGGPQTSFGPPPGGPGADAQAQQRLLLLQHLGAA